jgi:hypothetical protein
MFPVALHSLLLLRVLLKPLIQAYGNVFDLQELTSGFGPKPEVGHVVQFSYQISTQLGQLVALKSDAFARIGDGDVVPGMQLCYQPFTITSAWT